MNADIRCGDCLDVMRSMQAKSVDLIFTSPPYNMRTLNGKQGHVNNSGFWPKSKIRNGYKAHGDDLEYDDYVRWQKSVLLECWRLVSDHGVIFYNHKPRVQLGLMQNPCDLNPGLPLRQIVIWDRGAGFNHSPTFYTPRCEWIMVYAKPKFKLLDRGIGSVGDVWRINPERYNPHPCSFPAKLPLTALRTVAENIKTVLDPFCGSGAVGVACVEVSKDFIGIDNALPYCEMSRRRIALAQQGDFSSWNAGGV